MLILLQYNGTVVPFLYATLPLYVSFSSTTAPPLLDASRVQSLRLRHPPL